MELSHFDRYRWHIQRRFHLVKTVFIAFASKIEFIPFDLINAMTMTIG